MWTPETLCAFEADLAAAFNRGEIRAPVHLSGGNEDELIAYFAERVRPGDWVLSTWRSHYHALLAGVPAQDVRAAVLGGRSIALAFPEHRFLASAIVGGSLPIALGLAMGLKRQQQQIPSHPRSNAKVHCFLGDMAARTGAFAEAVAYAGGHDLPVTFIVEDNDRSVATPTADTWGQAAPIVPDSHRCVYRYRYELTWPHQGTGQWVAF